MKIIKKGKVQKETYYIGTCNKCDCKVRVGLHESTGRLSDGKRIVTCPTKWCYSSIIVNLVSK